MRHKLLWVDAFTDQKLNGNPCAVIFSADTLSDIEKQNLAREMNLSETAFVVRSSKADFGARYFTPAEEIPLAGHPTISTICALIEEQQIQLKEPVTKVSLELKAGVISVEIHRASPGEPHLIVMSQRRPTFLSIHDPRHIARIFGLTEEDLLSECPVQTVSTGTPQLMVSVKSLEVLKRLKMDVPAYLEYKARSDFFSPHIFCMTGVTSRGTTFARHLGVFPDTLEDAFTGSATGGMGAYVWRYGLTDRPKFVAEQGHWMGRPGHAQVEIIGPATDIETVKVGGTAVVLIRGELEV